MNLDHIFLFSGYARNELRKISAYRSDRKGRGIAAFASAVASKKDINLPTPDIAFGELDRALSLGVAPVVIVSSDIDRDKKAFAKVFDNSENIWLDIYQLAWPLVLHTAISKERTFKELCHQFDVRLEGQNEGMEECLMLSQLYWAMMARYKTSLFGEEVIREAGGKALASVRRMFGV